MAKDSKSQITLDDLAGMVKQGFDAVGGRIDKVEQVQKDMLEELIATHADVRYLRSSVDILTRNEAERDAAVKDLTARVHRLEQKAGLAK